MNRNEILNYLYNDIHSVCMSTIDEEGKPFSAFMDIMRADESGIYVSTSRWKKLYRCLDTCPYVSLCGMSGDDYFTSKMITFRGKVENIGPELWADLLEENSYLYRLFPKGDDSEHDVFRIHSGEGDYQDFSEEPPVKHEFTLE